MAKIPTDEQGQPFQLRPGVDPFGPGGWRGVNTEDDPGSLDPNELQWAENIRFRGRNIITRPGLSELIDFGLGPTNVDNHVKFMHEAPSDNPRVRLWISARGCFGAEIGTGSTIFSIDPTQIPVVQAYARFYTASDFQAPLGVYGNKMFVGDRSILREIIPITPHPGVSAASLLFSPSQSPVAEFPGFVIRALKEYDSKLFIALEDIVIPGASKIVTWDGVIPRDDLTGIRPVQNFGIWQNLFVAALDSVGAAIRVRGPGSSPGAWSSIGLAGFRCATQGNAMEEIGPYLYIASGFEEIYRFNGTALTVIHTVAGADTGGSGVTALGSYQGLLHYGWNTPSPDFWSSFGRYDPDSTFNAWLDDYKDLTADEDDFRQVSSMHAYRNQLYAGGQSTWVVATAPNDVKGTVEVVNGGAVAGAGAECNQCLRFP